jgi:myo-inositol-1(or 4)-monophosphatase
LAFSWEERLVKRGQSEHRAGRGSDLQRIGEALKAAAQILRGCSPQTVRTEWKGNGEPVTELDRAVNDRLRELLPRADEGWLSEETADDLSRLEQRRVWVVDPLDGTRDFLAGIPEWCVSIALVEDGRAVAGGICNPAQEEFFLGSLETGVTLNGEPSRPRPCRSLPEAIVLASRSETARGEWAGFQNAPFRVQAMGSVAYKLACVAAGRAEATWTRCPKNEWDVAAGVALVLAAGGTVATEPGPPRFNRRVPRFDSVLALGPGARRLFAGFLADWDLQPEKSDR